MEIAGEDGSRISLSPKMKTVFGRGSGFNTSDRKVSRRQVLFSIDDSDGQTEPRVSFEVIGKNPVWVRSGENGEVKVFRWYEQGEVTAGDWFCVCGQSPVWFRLKRNYDFQEEKKGCTNSSGGKESIDLSKIDPIREFGFLVIGHEFDQYVKQRILNIKNWDWFLEEPIGGSDDETFDKREKKLAGTRRRKRGKAKGKDDNEEDDDWTGESEEDKELIAKARKIGRPTYSTRSKDRHKHPSSRSGRSLASKKKNEDVKEIEDEDNDNDDTLGGFIVDDDDEEEQSDVDQEEDDLEAEAFDDD